jgi:hypothetical protein
MMHNHASFANLPAGPHPTAVTDKYMFIDTRKVVEDMKDLGYEVADFRRPATRTAGGAYGHHAVDFRRSDDIAKPSDITPRIVFVNSYDGSKRAAFMAGVFRLVCLNGLVVGDVLETHKFLHLGDYADELLEHVKTMAANTGRVFDRIEDYRSVKLDAETAWAFAKEAAALRWQDEEVRPDVDPKNLLMVRRNEDLSNDLWTKFNVVQENLIRGGVPLVNKKGQARLAAPVRNIDRSNELNRQLWNLADRYAEAA